MHIWYAGLDSPERHIAHVKSRRKAGGHDIPEADIRRRYETRREILVWLMPKLASLLVYDNQTYHDPYHTDFEVRYDLGRNFPDC